jgi:hypothetical protein
MCKPHIQEQAPNAPEIPPQHGKTDLAALIHAVIGTMPEKIKMFLYIAAVRLWNHSINRF